MRHLWGDSSLILVLLFSYSLGVSGLLAAPTPSHKEIVIGFVPSGIPQTLFMPMLGILFLAFETPVSL